FIAVWMHALPVGVLLWVLSIRPGPGVWLFSTGLATMFGISAAGHAWMRRDEDVETAVPLQKLWKKLGVNGTVENFVRHLYIPGVQYPECNR
ncbi:MAG: hypothetical protein ABEJ66_01830, partial [Candidatus Nanohaloarchaea archaeon]